MMDTTRASVTSVLQRAGQVLAAHRACGPSQQVALARLGEVGQRELAARYTTALRGHDVAGMLELLTTDATWAMPPLVNWFSGREAIAGFLVTAPYHVSWRHRPARANGQIAVGCYDWDEASNTHVAYALDVLTVRGDSLSAIVSFIGGSCFSAYGLPDVFT